MIIKEKEREKKRERGDLISNDAVSVAYSYKVQ